MAGPATDIQHRGRRLGQMLEQLLVQHVGAHVPFDGGIGLIGELVGQTGPGVVAHRHQVTGGTANPRPSQVAPPTWILGSVSPFARGSSGYKSSQWRRPSND